MRKVSLVIALVTGQKPIRMDEGMGGNQEVRNGVLPRPKRHATPGTPYLDSISTRSTQEAYRAPQRVRAPCLSRKKQRFSAAGSHSKAGLRQEPVEICLV